VFPDSTEAASISVFSAVGFGGVPFFFVRIDMILSSPLNLDDNRFSGVVCFSGVAFCGDFFSLKIQKIVKQNATRLQGSLR